MIKENKNNKKLIIITVILLVLLVGIGIVMSLMPKSNDETVKDKEVNDNRCVDDVCISKVTLEENNDNKTVSIVIKNEGKETVNNSCVNIIHDEMGVKYCFDELTAGSEGMLILNASEWLGDNIKDYKLEKVEPSTEENKNNPATE